MGLFDFNTPGDFLRRCDALERRMQLASESIERGGALVDEAFRAAWRERLRRWQGVRAQCGDFGSRMWGSKWSPILADWTDSQVEWEREIERRTGRVLPVPELPADENPVDLTPGGDALQLATQLTIGVVTAIVLVGLLSVAYTRKA